MAPMLRTRARVVAAAAALGVAAALVAVPASGAPRTVYPVVECVTAPLDGATEWTAHFRALNATDAQVIEGFGVANYFVPNPAVRPGHPSVFDPYEYVDYATTFDPASATPYVEWQLMGEAARATTGSPRCEQVLSAPALVGVPAVGREVVMAGERVLLPPTRGYDVDYRWYRGCDTAEPLQVANSRSYVVLPDDVGHRIQGVITYRRTIPDMAGGLGGVRVTTPCDEAATAGAAPESGDVPTIAGLPRVGVELSLSGGSWSGSAVEGTAVRWEACDASTCETVGSGATYTPALADLGRSVRAVVTASNRYGSGRATTVATGPVRPGGPPTGRVAPGSLVFAATAIGADREMSLRYDNDAGEATEIAAITVSGAAAEDFEVLDDGCEVGTPVAVGDSCAIAVRFAPHIVGERAATLVVDDGTQHLTPLSGLGGAVPAVGTAPSLVGEPIAGRQLTLAPGTWTGTGPLARSVRWETCTAQTCTAVGTGDAWTPTVADVGRTVRAVVTVANAYGSVSATTPALGPVVGPPASPPAAGALVLSASRVVLGKVRVHKPGRVRKLSLSNGGGSPLVVRSVTVRGRDHKDVVLATTCPGDTIAPGASCSVAVRLRPTAPGPRKAVLTITTSAGSGTIVLAGTGVRRRR